MRTSILVAGWTALVLLLPANRGAGQDSVPKDKPYVYFSSDPQPNPEKAPANPLLTLNLRHNQDAPYFVQVHNPTPNEKKLKVELVTGAKNKVVADGEVTVPGNSTKVVTLAAKKGAVPPPAPPVPGPDGKPVPAPAPAIPLEIPSSVRIIDGDEVSGSAAIVRLDPDGYTTSAPSGADANGLVKITVERRLIDKKLVDLAGGPVPVKLVPRNKNGMPFDPALFANNTNSLEAVLAPTEKGEGAKKVILSFNRNNLPKDAEGFLDLTIDGVARSSRYTLSGGALNTDDFGVAAPVAANPGKTGAITLGLMAPLGAKGLRLVFDRTPGDEKGEQILKSFDKSRNESLGVRIGEGGEAVFVTKSVDWTVELPTQGLYGKKEFFARKDKDENKAMDVEKSGVTTVIFDASPPKVHDLGAAPVTGSADAPVAVKDDFWFRPGQKIVVIANGKDDESGIDDAKGAILYLGEKPGADGKPAPGSQVVAVKSRTNGRFEAEFTIPATTAVSKLKIGAILFNKVGLSSAEGVDEGNETTINVDFTPPEVSILDFQPAKEPLQAFKPGETVRLVAAARDLESGINLNDPVIFFLGDAPGPDGKQGQTNVVWQKATGVISGEKGKDDYAGKHLYAADITLPKIITKETEFKVGVMFKNKAGLYGSRVATIKLDKDFTTATIKVKVTQGSNERFQPGVKVWLVDKDGNIADEKTTDEDCGIAVFEKVLPGTYLVWAVKAADQNSQDYKTVTVRGGDELDGKTAVKLSLRRQLAPPIKPPKEPKQ